MSRLGTLMCLTSPRQFSQQLFSGLLEPELQWACHCLLAQWPSLSVSAINNWVGWRPLIWEDCLLAQYLPPFLVTRVNRRYLAAAGLLLVILANYFSTQSPDLVPLMLSRLVRGIGAGVCYSTCTASLAGSHNSARTFSILLFVLVVMNAFIFYIFPIIDGKWGVNGLFMFYLLEAVPILLILPLLPRYCVEETDEVVLEGAAGDSAIHLHIPDILPRLCLAAVFSFYILVGAYWAFIERAGA